MRRLNSNWTQICCAAALLILALSWLPIVRANGAPPQIVAQSALAVDADTGEILFEKNADQRAYPASLTKLMTAMLLSENKEPDDILTCSLRAQAQLPVKLDLAPDTTMTAAEAMDALLVASANDVAYMVAENVSGTAEDFARLMNARAEELGLHETHFVNPHGLHDDNHFSTAADLVALFREALEDPWIRETMGKSSVTLPSLGTALTNTNQLLGTGGCAAGKTGYTSMAGKCLAALYERGGRRVAAVMLQSATDDTLREDMESVIRWSFR